MGRVYIVGDIHGCCHELDALVSGLPLTRSDRLIFLGDYIDRGPATREVIDFLLQFKDASPCEVRFLKGNHEDMFLDFMGKAGRFGEAFLNNGGNATLRSYGISQKENGLSVPEQLPPEHMEFFTNLEMFTVVENVLCVHAGVNPVVSLAEQSPEELLWIRQEFLNNPHLLPYTIVFGHTPHRKVRFELPYKIGIDTGLVYGGKLSCLEVTEKLLYQISKGSSRVQVTNVTEHWTQASLLPVQTNGLPALVHQVLPQSMVLAPDVLKTVFASDPRFFYTNAVYEEAYKNILSAIRERKGLVILLGKPGTGKTKLIHLLTNSLEETVHEVTCSEPEMTFDALLTILCDQLSLRLTSSEENAKLEAVEDALWAWTYRGGAEVLVLDDAHNLSVEALKKLPQLLALEGPHGKLLQIVLVARPELEAKLDRKELRFVQECVSERCRLVPLHKKEVDLFIHHRFRAAGWNRHELFAPEAVKLITQHSEAIPEQINALCNNAMVAAYATGQEKISPQIIEEMAAALKKESAEDLAVTEPPRQPLSQILQHLRHSSISPGELAVWRLRSAITKLTRRQVIGIGLLLMSLVLAGIVIKPLSEAWWGRDLPAVIDKGPSQPVLRSKVNKIWNGQ
jgi:serine/threonine protein phosphatase 1